MKRAGDSDIKEDIEMAVTKLTVDNFEQEVLQADKPVLVDFYADWCGPCKMLSPIVEQISEEYADEYLVGKINVDEQPGLALKYRVMSIPMLVTMNLGMFAAKSIGVITKEEVLDLLQQAAVLRDQKVES